eukprot:scpid22228/ scgid23659/ 
MQMPTSHTGICNAVRSRASVSAPLKLHATTSAQVTWGLYGVQCVRAGVDVCTGDLAVTSDQCINHDWRRRPHTISGWVMEFVVCTRYNQAGDDVQGIQGIHTQL